MQKDSTAAGEHHSITVMLPMQPRNREKCGAPPWAAASRNRPVRRKYLRLLQKYPCCFLLHVWWVSYFLIMRFTSSRRCKHGTTRVRGFEHYGLFTRVILLFPPRRIDFRYSSKREHAKKH